MHIMFSSFQLRNFLINLHLLIKLIDLVDNNLYYFENKDLSYIYCVLLNMLVMFFNEIGNIYF